MIWEYIVRQYRLIPIAVYECLLVVLIIGATLLFKRYGVVRGYKKVMYLLLSEYVTILFLSTIIYRNMKHKISGHEFTPFWSYLTMEGRKEYLLIANLMNIVAFVPIGFLLVLSANTIKCQRVLLIGSGISLSIEITQLLSKRGFAEIDDVIHNTIGVLIGYMIAKAIIDIPQKFNHY